jgi:hypothetical protein
MARVDADQAQSGSGGDERRIDNARALPEANEAMRRVFSSSRNVRAWGIKQDISICGRVSNDNIPFTMRTNP